MESWLEYAVIATYFAFLLVLGFIFQKFSSNVSDYFRNGCKGTWWLVGTSTFIAGISAYTFAGAAGLAYDAGFSSMIVYTSTTIGLFINFLFLAPYFRRIRATTGPEVIKLRYGVYTQQFFAWLSIPTYVIGAGLQLYALGIFSSGIFGFNIELIIIVMGLVVLFYSATGGSWVVMATDFIQTIILFTITMAMAVLALQAVGGVGGLFEMIDKQGLTTDFAVINAPGRFSGDRFTWIWALAMLFNQILGQNSLSAASRFFAVKDDCEARKAALLGTVLAAIGALFWFIPPIVARLLYSAEVDAMNISHPSEASYAIIARHLLPNGMIGIMIVAMFAATMSSMDSGLNRNAAILVCDIYPALRKLFGWKEISQKRMLTLSRIFTLLFGLCIILMALFFSRQKGVGQFDIILKMVTLVHLPLVVPMFWGLFIKRVPNWSAMLTVIFGAILSFMEWKSPDWWGFTWKFHWQVFLNVGLGSLVFLCTKPFWHTASDKYREQVEEFFNRLRTPVDFEKEVGESNDLSQLKIIGLFTTILGLFILLLLFVDNPLSGRLCILAVGGSVVLVGSGMIWTGIRYRNKITAEVVYKTESMEEDNDSSACPQLAE